MRPSRRIPLLRGLVGASFATFIALASHVWVGGGMPGMLGIAVPWLLSLTVCTLLAGVLAGRRLSIARLSLSVLASQLLFHALFVLGSITPTGALAPHVHGALPLAFSGEPVLVPEDAGMWIAHGVAAVLTIVALHRGELIVRALLAVASDLATWLRRMVPTGILVALDLPALRHWIATPAPVRREPFRAEIHRRGPPLRLI
ncbi:hypothetical protein QF046_002424 [Microbacterium sp. W4I4]|uniref:hypothetical protein n=1 Tax=Microbacterium sp. W4I4 TaxID=3042295 RepID=UPI00278A1581|nr:hypothetical protein [Microbacterium sp. W4I4]MDQ0614783.1 hypothetical protein [Microbacterium sp. W4I4]